MNQRDSAKLAGEMAHSYISERGQGQQQENMRIHSAVFDQLFEFVPRDAVAAIIQRDGDGVPITTAFHNRQLYLLEVFPEASTSLPASRCSPSLCGLHEPVARALSR